MIPSPPEQGKGEDVPAAIAGGRLTPIDNPEDVPLAQHDGDIDGWCAARSHSDLGNAARLLARFGEDLLYVRHRGWHAWLGCYWDRDGGADRAQMMAHRVAAAIRREVRAVRRPT